jgi:hypothetical protein
LSKQTRGRNQHNDGHGFSLEQIEHADGLDWTERALHEFLFQVSVALIAGDEIS